MELFYCSGLDARLNSSACEQNRARARKYAKARSLPMPEVTDRILRNIRKASAGILIPCLTCEGLTNDC